LFTPLLKTFVPNSLNFGQKTKPIENTKQMKIEETPFEDLYIIEPKIFNDERGYFMESYNYEVFRRFGIDINFLQDNQSYSKKGVLRGLHFQNAPHAQTKLVRVIRGAILDVVVDLRSDHQTYGQHFSILLSSQNHRQLLVPKGFAHGFSVLSEEAEVLYKCDELYCPQAENGILYNDPYLGIDWGLPEQELIISPKDKLNLTFEELSSKFLINS
jgi:dTDP-4-dehydrorhamnose 3,5-epimerase